MRYTQSVDLWTLSDDERRKLPVGQWVTAGPDGPKGQFLGAKRASVVVAWHGNGKGRWHSYRRTLLAYARAS